MIQNPKPLLITAGGKIRCRRCKAQSSRTKLQCSKPALKGKAVCGHHGGYSTGPKTKEGKNRIRAVHLKHGQETVETKKKRSVNSTKIRYLRDLGNTINMFNSPHVRGRKPKFYTKVDVKKPENILVLLLETLKEWS